MLLLVLAGNFFLLIVGWAFVGAASYLLISLLVPAHDGDDARASRRSSSTSSATSASCSGRSSSSSTRARSTSSATFERADEVFSRNDGDLIAGCILLLVGAFAKSAQVPLHTWLPDAMEGPTPVSALIHAATMVTAGVYLIARMYPLFEQAPAAADVGAVIGCADAADRRARSALVVTDLKRVIAYSTMSQIGYMIMAVCAGAYVAGLFHLMTHAFFKALLFMAAGSVIAAMAGEQNLDQMGGFRKAMPFTFGCFVDRRPRAVGHPAVLGLLLQGRDPAVVGRARRLALVALRRSATSARS